MTTSHWETWTVFDWAQTFFNHFFAVRDTDEPIHTLSVGTEDIADAVTTYSGDGSDLLELFTGAMRRRLEERDVSLGVDAAQLWSSWDQSAFGPPPFLGHLVFTCAVASEVADTSTDENDFRHRLTSRLGRQSHALEKIRQLWEVLSEWLSERAHVEGDVRSLVLPDRGHLRIIGYSVKLAFPSRRDKRITAEVLKDAGLRPDTLEIAEVLSIIQPVVGKGRFTSSFNLAFDEFRLAFSSGRVDVKKYAFWRAIKEASRLSVGRSRYSCVLVKENADDATSASQIAMMTSHSAREALLPTYAIADAGFEVEGHDVFVTRKDGTSLTTVDEFIEVAQRLDAPHLVKQLRHGLMVFEFSEMGLFRAESSFPKQGTCDILLSAEKQRSLREFLHAGRIRYTERRARFDGWAEYFDIDVDAFSVRPLPLWLRGVVEGRTHDAQLEIIRGIRLASGYLGRPPFLPTIRCSDDVDLTVLPTDVIVHKTNFMEWSFDARTIDSTVRILANRGGEVVGVNQLRFWADIEAPVFKTPNDAWWYAETFTPDEPCRSLTAFEGLFGATPQMIECSEEMASPPSYEVADALASALAARFTRRRGIPELEFVELVSKAFADRSSHERNLIQRSWLECWFVERYSNPRWSNRVYFPVEPLIVTHKTTDAVHGRLLGLLTRSQRSRLRKRAELAGLACREVASITGTLPSVVEIVADTVDRLEEFGVTEKLKVRHIASGKEILRRVSLFVLQSGSGLPTGYEVFRTDTISPPFRIEWRRRDDSPHVFAVYKHDKLLGWTRSRVHAVFVATAANPSREYPRASAAGIPTFLPLPLARFLAATAPTLPSPASESVYQYPAMPSCLVESSVEIAQLPRRLQFLIAAAIGEEGEVPVPPPIAAALPRAVRSRFPAGSLVPAWLLSELIRFVGHRRPD
ncbi:MAG: hypothetical protein ACYC7A_14915 [Thermoanaerobaculia bacterium]